MAVRLEAIPVHLVDGAQVGRRPRGAVLAREAGEVHLIDEVELAEHARGGGDQRLAHVLAWEVLALEDDGAKTRAGEVGRDASAPRSTPYDSYVEVRRRRGSVGAVGRCHFHNVNASPGGKLPRGLANAQNVELSS